jgi:hypothetical protein
MQLLLGVLEASDVLYRVLNASQDGGYALKLGERLVLESALALLEDPEFQRGHGVHLVFKLGLGDPKEVLEAMLDAGQSPGCQMAFDGKGEVEDGGVGADDVLEEFFNQRAGLPLRLGPLIVEKVVVADNDHDLTDVAQAGAEERVEVVVAMDGR